MSMEFNRLRSNQEVEVRANGSRRVKTVITERSRTVQSAKDETDVNKIVKRFELQGIMPNEYREGSFLDVSQLGDYQEAANNVLAVEKYFMSLPAVTRAMFENSPARFLDAVGDPANRDKLIELGVFEKPVDEAAIAAAARTARVAEMREAFTPLDSENGADTTDDEVDRDVRRRRNRERR